MTIACKEWTRPAGFFSPKCTDTMFPIEGQGGCPVCVNPEYTQMVDTCGVFSFMKANPTDVVKIPSIFDVEFLAGELTTRIGYTCNLTAAAGTVCQTLVPELVGVRTRMVKTSDTPSVKFWSTPRIPIGTRHFHYNMKDAGGATIGDKYDEWDIDFQLSLVAYTSPCVFEFIVDLWKTRSTSVASGITTGYGSCPTSEYYLGQQLTSTHQQIWNSVSGYNAGSFNVQTYKTTSGSTPFFTEFNSDVSRHSPFNLRVGMMLCANKLLWWNSIDVNTVRTGLDGFGGPICGSRTIDVYPLDSTGFDEPAASPNWHPAALSFKMWGP